MDQEAPRSRESSRRSSQVVPRKGNWKFIGGQYFLQGILSSLPNTIILTYPQVPDYNTLSLFEAVKIPGALKFILAPFMEVYTSVEYGKRKLWILVSGILMGLLVLMASMYTTEEYQVRVAVIFLIATIFTCTSDIAVDALSLKELGSPEQISFVQGTAKRIGHIIGGFIFLKLVSAHFATVVGLAAPIMKVSTFFRIVGFSFILLQVFSHFCYKEEILQDEIDQKNEGTCNTIMEYRVFFSCSQKYFRTGVMMILGVQGILFFTSSYQFQLMKAGFSKERINQISTFSAFPIMVISYYYSGLTNKENMYKLSGFMILGRLAVAIWAYIYQPTSTFSVICYLFLEDMFVSLHGMTDAIIINYFPITAVSGMMITMLNSMRNFGHNFTAHLLIVGILGHRKASLIGFIYHALYMALGYRRMVQWVKDGQLDERSRKHGIKMGDEYQEDVIDDVDEREIEDINDQILREVEIEEDKKVTHKVEMDDKIQQKEDNKSKTKQKSRKGSVVRFSDQKPGASEGSSRAQNPLKKTEVISTQGEQKVEENYQLKGQKSPRDQGSKNQN